MNRLHAVLTVIVLGTSQLAHAEAVQMNVQSHQIPLGHAKIFASDPVWQNCATTLAQSFMDELFQPTADFNYTMSDGFTYRHGIDGYKFTFVVNEYKAGAFTGNQLSMNMRIKFNVLGETDNCMVDLYVGYPFYVTDSAGKTVAQIDGRTIAGRLVEAVGVATIETVYKVKDAFTPAPTTRFGILR